MSTRSNKPGLKQLPARVSILAVTTLDKLRLLFVPAAISLGHEHDLRVKHLSDALSDKHGPAAGKYRVGTGHQLVPPASQRVPLSWCSQGCSSPWPVLKHEPPLAKKLWLFSVEFTPTNHTPLKPSDKEPNFVQPKVTMLRDIFL